MTGSRLVSSVGIGRRSVLAGLSAAGLVLPTAAGRAIQPPRPRRQVTVLIGAPPGSDSDAAARAFADFLAPHLAGVALSLTNMPGDASRTMLATLGNAPPNGSIVGWAMTPTLPARIVDRSEPALGLRLQLLGQVEREPIAFVTSSNDPATAVQDIIRRASDDADAVPLGTPPAGSPPHLAALRLQVLAQTQLNIVTFPSVAAARQAVLDGNVSAVALGLSAVIGDIRDGILSAIGIAARRRFGLLPDAPLLDEGGIPLSAFIRRGLAVPAGTPLELIVPLVEAVRMATAEEGFSQMAEANGYYAAFEDGPAWKARMDTEQAALAKLWETNPWLSSSGG